MTDPALDYVEGFEHSHSVTGSTSTLAIFTSIAGGTYVSGRLAGKALDHVGSSGSSTTFARCDAIPSSNLRCLAFYIRLPDGAPTTDRSQIFVLGATGSVGARLTVRSAANGGVLELNMGSAGTRQVGPDVTDGNWHRVELKMNQSANPWTCDWRVDGTSYTQATVAAAASSSTVIDWGSRVTGSDAHVQFDDVIGSVTAADFDTPNWGTSWQVIGANPNGVGTPVLGSTNPIVNESGNATTLDTRVDDWVSGGVVDLTNYITYTNTALGDAASNYAELTVEDATLASVWGASGYISIGDSSSSTVTCRLVDGSGTTVIDIHSGAPPGSAAGVGRVRHAVPAPSGGWANFDNLKVRFGFSTDTNPRPRLYAVQLQYAGPAGVDATATPATVAAVTAVPSTATSAGATVTVSTVASVTAVPTPAVDVGSSTPATSEPDAIANQAWVYDGWSEYAYATTPIGDATATPGVVAIVVAVAAPTVVAEANGTPAVVAASVALTSPSVAAGATVTPPVVAAVASVPTPTITVGIQASPATIAAVASVPTPAITTTADATPARVAVLVAVPTPIVDVGAGDATAQGSVVAAVVAIPTPSVTTVATVNATVVAAIAAVPAPAAHANADATPAVVAAVVAIPAPSVSGDANATGATVAAVVAIPAPAVTTGSFFAFPLTVACVVAIPTPTIVVISGWPVGSTVEWPVDDDAAWVVGENDEWPVDDESAWVVADAGEWPVQG